MSRLARSVSLVLIGMAIAVAIASPVPARAEDATAKAAPAEPSAGKPMPGLPRLEEAPAAAPEAKALAIFPSLQHYSAVGNEFEPGHAAIRWASQGGITNRYVASCGIAVCHLAAPLHLPQGVQVKGVTCKVVDNSPTHPVGIVVAWAPGDGLSYSRTDCMAATSLAGASASIVSLSASCPIVVDNSRFAYFLEFHTYGGGATAGTLCENGGAACRVYDCFVAYQ